jgi:hypothetical protein
MILNPLKWFKNTTKGVFVEVFLDAGFGRIIQATKSDKPPFKPCLYISDIELEEAKKLLAKKQIDWNMCPAIWRRYLELELQFYKLEVANLKEFLK